MGTRLRIYCIGEQQTEDILHRWETDCQREGEDTAEVGNRLRIYCTGGQQTEDILQRWVTD